MRALTCVSGRSSARLSTAACAGLVLLGGCSAPDSTADNQRSIDSPDASKPPIVERDVGRASVLVRSLRAWTRVPTPAPGRSAPDSSDAPSVVLPPSAALSVNDIGGGLSPHVVASPRTRHPASVVWPMFADEPFSVVDQDTGARIAVRWTAATHAAAIVEDGYVVYAGVPGAPGVVQRASDDGTEDYIVFDGPPATSEVVYEVRLDAGIAGLRLVEGELAMLDSAGAPRLRMSPPYLVGADGVSHEVLVRVDGCAVDTNPVAPWGRTPLAPGSAVCTVRLSWADEAVIWPAALDPSWSTTGSLAVARSDAPLVALNNGLGLILGGRSSSGYLSSTELYDPATGTWAMTGPMPNARAYATATLLLDGRVLAAGGWWASYLTTADTYNPAIGLWGISSSLNAGRYHHVAAALADGRVLVAGGQGASYLSSAEIYDPAADHWDLTGPLASARESATASTLNDGRVLVAGGYNGITLNLAEVFDPASGTWSLAGYLQEARRQHAQLTLPSGKVLVAGGYASAALKSSELYDPAADTWSLSGSFGAARFDFAMVPIPAKVLAIAGATGSTTQTATTEAFNLDPTYWAGVPSLSQARSRLAAARLSGGVVLAAGGYGSSVYLKTAEVLTPAAICSTPADCPSGYCVDGYCCDTACAGGCDRCDRSPNEGTCTRLPGGYTGGNPSCGPYYCNGTSNDCPTTCSSAGNCTAGYYCAAGHCVPKSVQGSPCVTATECASGYCVDGFCCSAACSGPCDACNKALGATADGQCTPILGPGTPACGVYVCSGSSGTCPTSCTSDATCAAAYYCSTANKCEYKQSNGTACASDSQCLQGHCVDGYCCDTSCSMDCDRCDLTGSHGICSVAPAGEGDCAPYLCNGVNTFCTTSCVTSADCAAGATCVGGQCIVEKPNGQACTGDLQCISGHCADSVCCDKDCSGACDACKASLGASADGTCTNVVGPGDPTCAPFVCDGSGSACPTNCATESQCAAGRTCTAGACVAKSPIGTACAGNDKCLSGFCVDAYCCDTACVSACDACAVSLGASANGTCTLVTGPGSPSCSPYLCSGSAATCPTSCSSDAACAGAFHCGAGACEPKSANGTACTAASECASGSCADGVCCDQACSAGSCDRCNLAGSVGTCSILAKGAPGEPPGCGNFVCDGVSGACPTTCTSDDDCASEYHCTASACVPNKPIGQPCTVASECASKSCADGVCCDTACTGSCDRCDLPASLGSCTAVPAGAAGDPSCAPYLCDGSQTTCPSACSSNSDCATGLCFNTVCTPKLELGTGCTLSVLCESGFCVDNVCCETACDGQCATCNAPGSAGTCKAVTGNPVGGRSPCAGNDGCAGQCDGTLLTGCSYPGHAQQCAPPSCTNSVAITASTCDGNGACAPGATTDCGEAGCLGDVCASTGTDSGTDDASADSETADVTDDGQADTAAPDAGEPDGAGSAQPPTEGEEESGCGCRTADQKAGQHGWAAGVLALIALAVRRRRRSAAEARRADAASGWAESGEPRSATGAPRNSR